MAKQRNLWDMKRGIWQPKISEEMVLREIVSRLWYSRIKVWRIRERIPGRGPGALSTPGIPDLIGWIHQVRCTWDGIKTDNRFAIPLFIEVKRPGGVHRIAQERWIAEAKADGCIAFFAESWADVVRELTQFGIKIKEAA